jgi:hypothetical protein
VPSSSPLHLLSFAFIFFPFLSPLGSNLEVKSNTHSFPLPPHVPHLPLHGLLLHLSCQTPSYVHLREAMASMDYMYRYHVNFLAPLLSLSLSLSLKISIAGTHFCLWRPLNPIANPYAVSVYLSLPNTFLVGQCCGDPL